MKIMATQRLLSQMNTAERITHYKKQLEKVKHRMHLLHAEDHPELCKKYAAQAIRLEKRIFKLQLEPIH